MLLRVKTPHILRLNAFFHPTALSVLRPFPRTKNCDGWDALQCCIYMASPETSTFSHYCYTAWDKEHKPHSQKAL